MNNYEGMFLLNPVEAKRDWDAAAAHVQNILKKNGAEISTNYRWDERKLAYDVKRQKRGVYYLVYFKTPENSIAAIKRECYLSEIVMRTLILRLEGEIPPPPTPEELAKRQAEMANVEVGRPMEREFGFGGDRFRRGPRYGAGREGHEGHEGREGREGREGHESREGREGREGRESRAPQAPAVEAPEPETPEEVEAPEEEGPETPSEK